MATEAPAAAPPAETPQTLTTRRGIAAASLCLGFWANLIFFLYPLSLFIATAGLVLGLVARRVLGVRVERHGADLALIGIFLNLNALAVAFTAYRVVQVFFEGQPALMPLPWLTSGVDQTVN